MIELNVLRSPGKQEFTRIAIYRERGYSQGRANVPVPGQQQQVRNSTVVLETSYSSTIPGAMSRPPEEAQIKLEPNEPIILRVFIDKSVVEVFVNGKQALAARVYPGRDDSIGVSLRSQGGNVLLKSLDAWQLKNIYADK
jgi:beta-fructofuranosidase